jgi:hypothetical protein
MFGEAVVLPLLPIDLDHAWSVRRNAVLTMSENREISLRKVRNSRYGVTRKKHLLSSFTEP